MKLHLLETLFVFDGNRNLPKTTKIDPEIKDT